MAEKAHTLSDAWGREVNTVLVQGARVMLVVCVLVTVAFAFAPPSTGAHILPWDKADHFCAFFAITTAAVVSFPRTPVLWIAVAASALGAGIELVQALPVVDRDCDVWDWVAENIAIGAVVGVVIAASIRRRIDVTEVRSEA
jgi:hypothetical protein